MSMWNPWRGCKKCSDGCLHCYIHKGDAKRGIVTDNIVKTKDFEKPVERLKSGSYKMKAGIVYTCFSTDFLIEEADEWRLECWSMIRERSDCTFLFLTKRIERFSECIPDDWVLDIRKQCIRKNVDFEFRQCGTHFIKDGKRYKLKTKDLCKQARLANIDYKKR